MVTPGRREAHKAQTRAALLEAAGQLFAVRGYEATTVREIAEAAQVTERTFYRYFEGKEALVAQEAVRWIETLGEAIVARPATEAPLEAVAGALGAVLRAAPDGGLGGALEGGRSLRVLQRTSFRPLRRLEGGIAAALARRRGATTPAYADEVLARVAVSTLRSAVIRHRELLAGGLRSPGAIRLLHDGLAVLAGQDVSTPR